LAYVGPPWAILFVKGDVRLAISPSVSGIIQGKLPYSYSTVIDTFIG
jgi:hypothetical protein